MNIVLLMIPCTFILVIGFIAAFVWANKNKQFDDLVTPAHRILADDDNNELKEEVNE